MESAPTIFASQQQQTLLPSTPAIFTFVDDESQHKEKLRKLQTKFTYLKEPKKRTRTTADQLNILLQAFEKDPTPNPKQRKALADKTGMTARTVQVWFQNRRAKYRVQLGPKESSPLFEEDSSASDSAINSASESSDSASSPGSSTSPSPPSSPASDDYSSGETSSFDGPDSDNPEAMTINNDNNDNNDNNNNNNIISAFSSTVIGISPVPSSESLSFLTPSTSFDAKPLTFSSSSSTLIPSFNSSSSSSSASCSFTSTRPLKQEEVYHSNNNNNNNHNNNNQVVIEEHYLPHLPINNFGQHNLQNSHYAFNNQIPAHAPPQYNFPHFDFYAQHRCNDDPFVFGQGGEFDITTF